MQVGTFWKRFHNTLKNKRLHLSFLHDYPDGNISIQNLNRPYNLLTISGRNIYV